MSEQRLADALERIAALEAELAEAKESFRITASDENEMCEKMNRVIDKYGGWVEDEEDTYASNFQRIINEQVASATGVIEGLVGAISPLAILAGEVNMNDPLHRWLTIGQLHEAKAALASAVKWKRGSAEPASEPAPEQVTYGVNDLPHEYC